MQWEALAIQWAIEKLRYYLARRHFTLITDHALLQWITKAKDTNARVTQWFLALQDFSFQVQHQAEAQHSNVDGDSKAWGGNIGGWERGNIRFGRFQQCYITPRTTTAVVLNGQRQCCRGAGWKAYFRCMSAESLSFCCGINLLCTAF